MRMRVFSYFRLQPHNHTDEKSLLFFAAYFSRLVFPLGYNYLGLIEGLKHERKLKTEFSKVHFTMYNHVFNEIFIIFPTFLGHGNDELGPHSGKTILYIGSAGLVGRLLGRLLSRP